MGSLKQPNKVNNIVSLKTKDNINLSEETKPDQIISSYYFNDFLNTKQLKRFIKNVESKFRKCDEYTNYLGILNSHQNINRCSVFGNIENGDASLEFHHYPFTLYDIVEIVINYYYENKIPFNSFIIIQEILKLHYENIIGLVKLSLTVHELVHSGKLFIKFDSIFGNVNEFVNRYYDYIPSDLKDKYNSLCELNNKENDESILNTNTLITTEEPDEPNNA